MKVSRHFLVIVLFLFLITGGVYYFFTKADIFDTVSADNLGYLDTFLLENYSFALHLDKGVEDAARIYCDPFVATSTEEDVKIAYPCQNQNPLHKIVIGWAGGEYSYKTIMKALGNEQLFWRNYPSSDSEEGSLSCKKREDYSNYQGAVFGIDCVMTVVKGENELEKLYSSTIFLKEKDRTTVSFITVMNTSKPSSPQQVEMELLALISKLKESPTKYRVDSLSIFGGSNKEDISGNASSSSLLSTEADVPQRSFSANTITRNSGSGIDATVCDLVDTTSCYPLYCESLTAVWNYSLNKCVEPDVSSSSLAGGKHCGEDAPVWDGSKCRALSGDVVAGNSCTIPTGGSSCQMNIFWSAHAPKGNIEIRRRTSPTESIVLAKGQSDTLSYVFPYQEEPYTIELYDGSEKLNDAKFTTRCEEGGWDIITKKCVNPQVTHVTVSGEYYKTPGAFNFSCSNAESYIVRYADADAIIATGTYTGEVHAPTTKSGNYSAVCRQGGYTSSPEARYYNAPPPPPAEISLLISPRTVFKDEKSILNWNIHFPLESCMISAKVICKNANCSTAQSDYENEINQILQSDFTDKEDQEGSRPIMTSIKSVAPSHVDSDWMATGQKTLTISYTTDFTLSCEGVPAQTKRVYIRVNKEQQ